jgi:hypothetical protein
VTERIAIDTPTDGEPHGLAVATYEKRIVVPGRCEVRVAALTDDSGMAPCVAILIYRTRGRQGGRRSAIYASAARMREIVTALEAAIKVAEGASADPLPAPNVAHRTTRSAPTIECAPPRHAYKTPTDGGVSDRRRPRRDDQLLPPGVPRGRVP